MKPKTERKSLFRPLPSGKRRTWAHTQFRIAGGRIPCSAALEDAIAERVRQEAARFDVSPQFVISVALADYFNVTIRKY